jgi:hypothetical protein
VDDADWDFLLRRIRSGSCTPFLGAGAAGGVLPLGGDIAQRWAKQHGYPLDDPWDLSRVAQFMAVKQDSFWPKDLMREELEGRGPPDFARPDEPHAALAGLPLPVYITTNYDDFMVAALQASGKEPRREFCRWNTSPEVVEAPVVLDRALVPTAESPVVYHLHGHLGVLDSLVLTEDDYRSFLVRLSRDANLLPHQILKRFAATSLLFLGYRLADWSFRVIHWGIVMAGDPALRRLSVTVQLPMADEASRQYLDEYFGKSYVRVFWGTAEEFASQLQERWARFDGG